MFADFDQIMERLATKQLWDFAGGVHPDGHKGLSNQHQIADAGLPDYLYIPIKQHIGVDAELIVNVGDRVKSGQPLTESHNPFAVPVHASSSGEVIAIDEHIAAHPSGIKEATITIKVDGLDTQYNFDPVNNYNTRDKAEIVEAICKAGISGMGGAGFPTHLKSNNVKPIEFLIINGVECEPYITADDRLMREHAWQIRQGIDVLNYLLKPRQVLIAIEDNKPEAFETMSIACQQQDNYQVISIPTKYPAGGEKQLIQMLTSREVPSDGLPVDVGCLMYNVGTCYAVADAIIEGKPLTKRVVTLTGKALEKPQNFWVKIGTPVEHLLQLSGYNPDKQEYPRIIMGGPMMGFTLSSVKVPVIKTTNCLLAPEKNELAIVEDERACIRCSACADACPISLLPQQLYWYSTSKDYEVAQQYNLFDCIECGACAFVCPSEIPLVHYYRIAKAEIRQQKVEKEKSEKAKQRFEARKARLLKEKKEREEKHRLAAEARKRAMQSDDSGAKDKIAAALARAKAKKAGQATTEAPKESSGAPQAQSQQDKVAAAIARAKAKKAAQQSDNAASEKEQNTETQKTEDNPSQDDKKAKVAAAIARAKAKKAAQQSEDANEPKQENDQQASEESKPASEISEQDKKAKIAAAIARAKAKKAANKKANDE
ncbi:electron transport complex subunit RsxC [Glaciecola sp. 1036]|uniref:electron transport complex subunit RsxC n=1 Tax=Alteromonadaceae TaxID=72275 RepID=UPI003D0149D4